MNGLTEQITFLGLGVTLAMMALGLVSAVVIPGIDRWNRRFFAAFFAVFLLGRITYTVDVMLYGIPGMETVERAVWFLQSLLGSIPMPMFTFYLVHCYGEDWRRSALFRMVLAIWGLYVLLLCIGQFKTLFYATLNWESRLRQDLRYPSGVTALLGITLLNLISVIRRWGALPPKKRFAFLALLLPVPVIFIYLVFSASGLLFTDIGISLSALSMFFIILHDQVEQDTRQQREIAWQRASIMVLQMRPHFIYNTMMSIYYVKDFIVKSLLMFSGLFLAIVGYGLWVSRYMLVYPIGSMTDCTRDFAQGDADQASIDKKVRSLRSLDIRTGDEVEQLYLAVCKMAVDTTDQVRSIRHYAENAANMQNGLIVTMADMVESRDSDTGAHIQKTAEYVKIILDGLRRKGYYPEKLTDKFISDTVMSAPLHDVGKINISDTILNKPGKLTDEEFAVMKTHTTAGRAIIERAMSTVQGESYLMEARNMAACHHERWDGKGYPEGLHGEAIPLSARVMAVADVFDALTSRRVYKPAFPIEKAVEILREGAGTQFDPKCVEVFLDSIELARGAMLKYQDEAGQEGR